MSNKHAADRDTKDTCNMNDRQGMKTRRAGVGPMVTLETTSQVYHNDYVLGTIVGVLRRLGRVEGL